MPERSRSRWSRRRTARPCARARIELQEARRRERIRPPLGHDLRPARGRRGLRGRRARLEGRSLPPRARAGRGGFLSRVALISDTHLPRGSRTLPDACVKLLRAADLVLHGGDFVSVAFLEELQAIGPPVEGICGNMDEPALKASLPKQRVVEVG